MTDTDPIYERYVPSRRSVLKTGALATAGSVLGLSTTAGAQDDTAEQSETRQAMMLNVEWRSGAVFRVVSPALEVAPEVADSDLVQDRAVQVIEYFNTEEEVFLYLPQDADPLEEGEEFVLGDQFSMPTTDAPIVGNFVQVQFRPLDVEDFPFDLDDDLDLEFLDGGGEAAVRPRDFHSGALFRVTSGPQGWVPEDVADSGFFTDYDTHHARYLATNDTFLFFPQEEADLDQEQLYIMRDEFELFDPEGNLVATEFDPVDEETLTVDDEFL